MDLTIEDFHRIVDERVNELISRISDLNCRRGCADCCIDNITVFQVEGDWIIQNCNDIINEGSAITDACPFLDNNNSCRIYYYRPYVCRTQGLPLRWIEEDQDKQPVEYRDICSLNESVLDLKASEENFWTIGPYEEALSLIQYSKYGNINRVFLRSLFEK
ncbi:YkgJ family cysteine cluster protein [Myxococcota bacterium]|nr:YkgJ family cysteine cluster protein [Myxococcota bacterium]MBU1381249.1 YkgJ family cysteine cluster protein [Myxococcota bacterium]MBU1498885.1 YkgJ family cysteine cluster protein [Myxococcota bacterium]